MTGALKGKMDNPRVMRGLVMLAGLLIVFFPLANTLEKLTIYLKLKGSEEKREKTEIQIETTQDFGSITPQVFLEILNAASEKNKVRIIDFSPATTITEGTVPIQMQKFVLEGGFKETLGTLNSILPEVGSMKVSAIQFVLDKPNPNAVEKLLTSVSIQQVENEKN